MENVADQIFDALPLINHIATIAAIGFVLPTYFLRLRPATYRLVLSLGIAFALARLAAEITVAVFIAPYLLVLVFPPFTVVLIAILLRIARVNRVSLWSTVVLVCVIIDWAQLAGQVWLHS
ncbi:hypothetical protein JQ559_00900 [Bradyrhizobium viridifuturi]|nr:hypothetical protein [Bradyrhizobium viridifuturi]ERF85657.1 MAG: hypothetical protein C207_01146 [Bradyrhizobium sp. DFCI-1]MCA3776099.1 hypothetical protein [Cutibacterium sp.]MCA3792668.1 hypothetical protein [Burkholderia sp.]QRI67839.1 hypothetical protein JQ507_23105 [Bradyrhizobium sp. PSBB068]MBR1018425.1 hypothetical protein [Bradyrhizobium viridifuturi]